MTDETEPEMKPPSFLRLYEAIVLGLKAGLPYLTACVAGPAWMRVVFDIGDTEFCDADFHCSHGFHDEELQVTVDLDTITVSDKIIVGDEDGETAWLAGLLEHEAAHAAGIGHGEEMDRVEERAYELLRQVLPNAEFDVHGGETPDEDGPLCPLAKDRRREAEHSASDSPAE